MADQLVWPTFRPLFRREFAIQSNDKLIREGLSNLAMKSSKTTRKLLNRIVDTIVIIKEGYVDFQNKVHKMTSTEV
jgi:hypothetical protein